MQSASRIDRGAASPALIYALFLLSGVGGLVYEVIWIRRLTLIFGSGPFATSTILATFMGGLAFGSWWLGRKVDRVTRPLAMFGRLEIGIGLYAIALPLILAAVLPIYQGVYRTWEGNWTVINGTRLVLCGAVFVFPTFLMEGPSRLSRGFWLERDRVWARSWGGCTPSTPWGL